MPRRPAATADDPYDAPADALRAVVDDLVSRVVAAIQPGADKHEVMVSIAEAAKRLGLGTTKLKELIATGQIESVKVGERRLVPVSALEVFSTEHSKLGSRH
jgi:excisionase family DNA binding protein